MKKIAILMAVLMILLGMLAVFASCGGNTGDGTGSTQSGTTSNSSDNGGSSTAPSQNPGNTDNSTNNSGTDSSDTNNSGTDNSGTDNSGTGSSTVNPPDDQKPEEDPNLVKVTVINLETGKGINGVAIQICQGETCFFQPIKTGADGVGTRSYDLKEGQLKAKIISITGIDDFIASDEYVYFNGDSQELTMYVQRVVVNVFDDNEQAVEGAVVELSQGENEFSDAITTDADGMATGVITIHEGELRASVTEVLSGGAYDLNSGVLSFENGVYDGKIILKKKNSYTVKISTMFEEALPSAQVKLYADGYFEDVKTTNSNGVVVFENLGDAEYSVEIVFASPAYKIISSTEDGKFYFTDDSTTIEIYVVETEVTYTVNVVGGTSGMEIDIYNENNEYYTTAITDENGEATFMASNGYYTAKLVSDNYAAPVYFVRDGSAVGTITVTDKVPGSSKDAPIILLGSVTINAEAGQTIWFAVPNGHRKVVEITATNATLNYNGEETVVSNKTLTLIENKGEVSILSIKATDACEIIAEMKAPGTANHPIDITDKIGENGYTENVVLEKNLTVYYSFTAAENGVLSIFVPTGIEVLFNYEAGLVLEDGTCLFPVMKDETIIVSFVTYEVLEAPISANFNFGEKKINYTVYVSKDGDSAQGIEVILYANNGGELVEIARGTIGADGQYIFENIPFASNYVVKVAEFPEGYTSYYEYAEFLMFDYAYYSLTRIKTGEPDAPFEFDTVDELKETANVKENGTVWYTLYIRPNFSAKFFITAKSGNAIIKVYNSDTNEDGIINSEDEPIGVSVAMNDEAYYTFEANDMSYTIAVSTADGQAEDIELVYGSTELEAGATEENPIEVTGSGVYTAEVDGIVYYVFSVNESYKLTVTLEGEANLCLVERSMDGSTLIDVEDNTLVIDNTMGTWVYFAISAEVAGEYEFTVTVEYVAE